jgi:hypothetical protein
VLAESDRTLISMVCISLGIVVLNLFYNTLLINCRFSVKMKCVTLGLCLFDCVNGLFCYCLLKKVCKNNQWILLGIRQVV